MKKIAFILHGKIKKQDKIVAALKLLFADAADLIFSVTQHTGHASGLAFEAIKAGATHVICVGGDGSLNEVINGVMLARQVDGNGREADEVKVGLLPYGTGNDFARTMGIVNDIGLLKKWIETGTNRFIDIGYTEYEGEKGIKANRYFVNITDVGIGGAISQRLAGSSKILGPAITYQKAILTALLTYNNQPVNVQADSFNYSGNIMSLIVANGIFFGGGMGIAPHALPDDKLFSVVIIGQISMFEYLKNLGNIKKSKKVEHPEVKYLTASEIMIESTVAPLPVDMDGEFIGYTPIRLQIVPAAINFIAPK
jgi:diacylglycerol kinase (ATP)